MPIKNNRNSRDDKSNKVARSTKSSAPKSRVKAERTDGLNTRPAKLFAEGTDKPLRSARKSDSPERQKAAILKGLLITLKKENTPKQGIKISVNPIVAEPVSRFQDLRIKDPLVLTTESFQSPARKTSASREGGRPRKPFSGSEDKRASGNDDRKFSKTDSRKAGSSKLWAKPTDASREERPASRYGKPDTGKPFKKEYKPRTPYSSDERKPASDERALRRPGGKGRKSPDEKFTDGLIRLNRYIANAGICSRRKADELIIAGVISVNGEVVSELGQKVDPAKDVIRYNGEALKREKMVYVLLNKPKDYITTTDDPQERRTVMNLVEKASRERIYPVGRLDRNTTGLLLMTNDGALAEKLSHPRNSITKIYQVELNKNLTQGDLNKISFGLELEDGVFKPDTISYVQGGSKKEIGMQIHSGKNRIVRRVFEHLGYEVIKLDRVVYGNLTKKDLTRGRWRYLEEKEIIQLKHLIQ